MTPSMLFLQHLTTLALALPAPSEATPAPAPSALSSDAPVASGRALDHLAAMARTVATEAQEDPGLVAGVAWYYRAFPDSTYVRRYYRTGLEPQESGEGTSASAAFEALTRSA